MSPMWTKRDYLVENSITGVNNLRYYVDKGADCFINEGSFFPFKIKQLRL